MEYNILALEIDHRVGSRAAGDFKSLSNFTQA